MTAGDDHPFDLDSMVAAATASTGLTDFGDPRFRAGLKSLCEMLPGQAGLNEKGVRSAHKRIIRLLETRLRVEAAFTKHPEIHDRKVRRPVFLTGLPRTGTSAAFNLLAADPAARPLLLWEGTFPEPFEGLEAGAPDPRHMAMREHFASIREKNPEFTKIHFADADTPEECVIPMALTFENVHMGIEVLIEPYASFFRNLDLRPQYVYYRELLKMLDWQRPGERWLLKSPAHLWGLDALVEVFSDCGIVITHRDPLEAVASYCSMMETLAQSQGYSPQPNFGETVLDFCATSLERGYAVRDQSDPARFIDIRFSDFIADSMQVVRDIYDHFELPLTPEAKRAIEGYLRDHPRDKHGVHEYDLGQYGLRAEDVTDRLGWYIDRFELA